MIDIEGVRVRKIQFGRRIAQIAAAGVVVVGGLVATGTAAMAAPGVYALSANNAGGATCVAGISNSSGQTFNQSGTKTIEMVTDSSNYGCTLEVYLHSDSNAYTPYVIGPHSEDSWTTTQKIHRVRVCQSGSQNTPGSCSARLWWDHSWH